MRELEIHVHKKYPKPKYHFCWWCSRQLRGKLAHASMRPIEIANANERIVNVHLTCANEMEKEGGWENTSDAA